jgi:DNA-binding PadR family transcriptional regulator
MASCTDLKKPTAYYLLEKMAERDWIIVSHEEQGESNRPPRRVYRVTEVGEAAFQRLLRENLIMHHPAIFPGNIGLAFLDDLNHKEARQLLEDRRNVLMTELTTALAAPVHAGSMQLVIDHQIHHLKSEVEWLNQIIAKLEI